jgi:hypothetical protein
MPSKSHRITCIDHGNGVWVASCKSCGQIGTGDEVYISYVVAIHQGNHLPS